ncbi:hypothetical protein [Ammoniphilus sp. YIM 78166]|uniref:DUF6946 family protein n=1 Tax=Ammoniphilus sp. YIM 78166 TaxID=1644106 RepID=UPI001070309B|nr:hypothetical protein [Ammoniphilus sp. YIM 78166]
MIIKSSEGKLIDSIEAWLQYSPPAKKTQWQDGRSAKEFAKAWFRTGKAHLPDELLTLLESHQVTRRLEVEEAIPEKKTVLDNFRGNGRNHDMILIGKTQQDRIVISIEAKTDEPFGELIGKYLVRVKSNSRSSRINQLSLAVFGHTEVSNLRYQLLHAMAGTLIEAKKYGATQAILIVHELVTGKKGNRAKRNDKDLSDFINALSNLS